MSSGSYIINKFELQAHKELEGAMQQLRVGEDWSFSITSKYRDWIKQQAERAAYKEKQAQYKNAYARYLKLIEEYDQPKEEFTTLKYSDKKGKECFIRIPIYREPLEVLQEKKEILSTLYTLTNEYLQTGDKQILTSIRALDFLSSPFEYFTVSNSTFARCASVDKELEELIRGHVKRVIRKQMVRRFARIVRDIRYLFRSIIRFHFKNMDDESDGLLFGSFEAQQLVLLNSHLHEHRYTRDPGSHHAPARAA